MWARHLAASSVPESSIFRGKMLLPQKASWMNLKGLERPCP
jgi:hypothetical protein